VTEGGTILLLAWLMSVLLLTIVLSFFLSTDAASEMLHVMPLSSAPKL
jgi:hypothetical protein